MRSILLTVPDDMKAQLDVLRGEKGYSLNGYCRAAIARALAQEPKRSRGIVSVTHRKPGGVWKHRRIARRHVEQEILLLEDQGAEINVSKRRQDLRIGPGGRPISLNPVQDLPTLNRPGYQNG